jgi:hypothetical protein
VVRDMDLARKILFEVEKQPYTERYFDVRIQGVDKNEVQYDVLLLAEAGLIEAQNRGYDQADRWMVLRLTWEGHEFLENVRDETQWRKTVAVVQNKTGGVAFEVVKELAKQFAKGAVSSVTGIPTL